MSSIKYPKLLKISNSNNGITFLISGILGMASFFAPSLFDNSDNIFKFAVISFCLFLITLVNCILLFIKEREHYFESCFLRYIVEDHKTQLDKIFEKLDDLEK